MSTLVLFFDGIGVGRDAPGTNPFAAIDARCLAPLAGRPEEQGARFKPLDATLGVPGLPQSATGQTTLLTGVNAAGHAGRHLLGLPGPTLWPLLEKESVFLKMTLAGRRPAFANSYTREHLDAERPRWSATTRSAMAGDVRLRMWDDEGLKGTALSHDYTGQTLIDCGYRVPRLNAEQAAGILCGLLDEHDFVLYEYFLTDLAGHRGNWHEKVEQARRAEELVDAVVGAMYLERDCLIVISDHGNLEEADHNRHTLNPIPFLVWGAQKDALFGLVHSLDDVTPALMALS